MVSFFSLLSQKVVREIPDSPEGAKYNSLWQRHRNKDALIDSSPERAT
jgi:hypothetical protein